MSLFIRIMSTMLIACGLLATKGQAYDPYWSMKGSTISGGSHYSDHTAFSATNTAGHQLQDPSGDWKATIALPYNFSLSYEVADISNVVEDTKFLLNQVTDDSLSLADVQTITTKAEAILERFGSYGVIINGNVMSNGIFPVIALTHPKL